MSETATDADLAAAIAEAEQAQARFLDLEHAALHDAPESRPAPGDVLSAAKAAELAARRVEVVRKRAEDTREARRREACAGLAGRIDQFYDQSAASVTLPVLARQACEAITRLRDAAAAHDANVEALRAEALDLIGPKPMLNSRTQAEHAHVAHHANGVRHGYRQVVKIGTRIDTAIGYAVEGDADRAAAGLTVTEDCSPPPPLFYVRDTRDQSAPRPVYGRLHRAEQEDLGRGLLIRMSEDEVDHWLETGKGQR